VVFVSSSGVRLAIGQVPVDARLEKRRLHRMRVRIRFAFFATTSDTSGPPQNVPY